MRELGKVMGMALLTVALVCSHASAVGTGSLDRVSGWYPAGTNLLTTATPGANDQFDGWSGDTNSATFGAGTISFAVDGPRAITATFSDIMHAITASAGAGGSISPSGAVSVAQGDDLGFTITPDANYHIADVEVDSSSIGAVGSHTFSNVMASHTIDATFAIDTYTVIFDLGSHGTLTGGSLTQQVAHGSGAVAPTFDTEVGWTFQSWDKAFASVTSNTTVVAQYTQDEYTLIYVAGLNGSISGSQTQTVAHGASASQVTAVPDTGYHFVDWNDGVLTSARTDSNVTNAFSVTANFAINTYTLTVDSLYGTPTPSGVTTSDWNTVISPSMVDATVINGSTQYVCTGWVGAGSLGSGSGTNTSFTITNNTTLSWQWTTNYWIDFQTTGN